MMQTTSEPLYLMQTGDNYRLRKVLSHALKGIDIKPLSAHELIEGAGQNKRILFAVSADDYGPDPEFYALCRALRKHPDCLQGAIAGVVIDGSGELYTKQAAQSLILAANGCGCLFPGKPLIEGTGSLYNQHIMAKRMNITLEDTYIYRVQEICERVIAFEAPHAARPKILVLHASNSGSSNTVWIGHEVTNRLADCCDIKEISLQNNTIMDCRGCSYTACLHFAQNDTCFYGGAIAEEVIPAIAECDAMLFLCPNYNDAVSANIMALFNRLTNMLLRRTLYDKYLYGIIVSGYSGSDIVSQQLLGAMCLNKTVMLPPKYCMMETAHEAGTAAKIPDIQKRIDAFAAQMKLQLLGQ